MGYKEAEKLFKKVKSLKEAIDTGLVYDPYNNDTESITIDLWDQQKQLIAIPSYDGAFIIRDALDRKQQIEILLHTLVDLLSSNNNTNLHCHHNDIDINDMMTDIWSNSNDYIDQMIGNTNEHMNKDTVLSKIRWITLGYQYNWTLRSYNRDEHVCFPAKLGNICKELNESASNVTKFKLDVQAAIINFYQSNSIMGGHQDDAEITKNHPVLSLSIGSPCIFLLGGFHREEHPLSIILRSGDVLFMGGKARLRIHGVPKVFIEEGPPLYLQPSSVSDNENIHYCNCDMFLDIRNDTNKEEEQEEEDSLPRKRTRINDDNEAKLDKRCTCGTYPKIEITRALKFLQTTRLNVNVRQVYPTQDEEEDKTRHE